MADQTRALGLVADRTGEMALFVIMSWENR
jgi:hypothetical protein